MTKYLALAAVWRCRSAAVSNLRLGLPKGFSRALLYNLIPTDLAKPRNTRRVMLTLQPLVGQEQAPHHTVIFFLGSHADRF